MASFRDFLPKLVSERFKQLFDSFDEYYHGKSDSALEILRNLYNTEFILPDEVVDLLLDMFGFNVSDLAFFDDVTRKTIKNNFVDNIFAFYRDRIRKDIYIQLLYIYGLQGAVYVLNTVDWINFSRVETDTYLDENLFTDIGLFTDSDITSDNEYRTPFLEIEIFLNEEFTVNGDVNTYLWYNEINKSVKNDMENIRYVLAKLFYTLLCKVNGKVGQTVNNVNGVDVITVTFNFNLLTKYRITYSDTTTDIFDINIKEENGLYYYFTLEQIFSETKIIKDVEILDDSNTVYITINCPLIYLELNDKMKFYIIIEK